MTFEDEPPPGPQADEWFSDAVDDAAVLERDAIELVLETDVMVSVFAAERFVRVDQMRRELRADANTRGLGVSEIVERGIRLELAAALRITEYAAGRMIATAEALVHRYPSVLDALSGARMTSAHAEALVDALDEVDLGLREELLPDLIVLAESEPLGSFRRMLRKAVEAAQESTLEQRYESAIEKRRVVVEHADDGMAWLMALMPAVEANAAHGRLTALAKMIGESEGETRTIDQIRADAFADLLIDGESSAHPEAARGIRATVVVTVPALTLLSDDARAGSATVEGVGPIPRQRALELCGGADGWMRVLTHPETGMVLSVGREQYRPPAALRRLVRWRSDRCMAPGCGIPAARCQIDHTLAWEHGGGTELTNHAPLCVGHHTVKHHGGWRVRQIDGSGGALEWTSPAGRTYVVQPERRVPVFRPDPGPPPF